MSKDNPTLALELMPPEVIEAMSRIGELSAKLDGYYAARKACEYIVEHSAELTCRCNTGKYVSCHENECPIGVAINALSEFRQTRG